MNVWSLRGSLATGRRSSEERAVKERVAGLTVCVEEQTYPPDMVCFGALRVLNGTRTAEEETSQFRNKTKRPVARRELV